MTLLAAFTVVLAVAATLRLTRLVVGDDLGLWYVRGPAALWALRHEAGVALGRWPEQAGPEQAEVAGAWSADRAEEEDVAAVAEEAVELREEYGTGLGWRMRLVSGLSCPFCVGFWIGAGVLLSLALVGGAGADGTAATVWRWVAGALALNYVAGHVGARLGDVDEEEG